MGKKTSVHMYSNKKSQMEIVSISPQTSSLWSKLVENYQSDVFHSPDWLHVLTKTYGFDIHAAILLDDAGEPEAGIPFWGVEDISKKRIVTLPFSDFCDSLVNNYEQWFELTEPLLTENTPYTIRCLHNDVPLNDDRFYLVKKAKWDGVDFIQNL